MSQCANCGNRVEETARFCSRCGAPQRDVAGAQPPIPLPTHRSPERSDVCEVLWWRGYLKSDFYAVAIGSDRREYEAGRSPKFYWRRNEPPPVHHKRARAAHRVLVEKLTEAGWERFGEARPWYALHFRRRASGLRVLVRENGDERVENEEESGRS